MHTRGTTQATPRPRVHPTAPKRRARLPLQWAAAAALVLVLGACGAGEPAASSGSQQGVGGSGSGTAADADEPTDETAGDSATADTRVVTDWRGREVEVPARPERVATIDVTPTMNLTLLGLTPVSAPMDMTDAFGHGFTRFVPDRVDLDAYEVVGFPNELDYEALAALGPELIIGFNEIEEADPAAFDKLSQIAPTVLYEFGTNADWRSRFHAEAEILGRTDEAEELEQRYEEAFDLVDDLDDTTFAFVRFEMDGGGAWRLENPATSIPGSVVADAGMELFEPPPGLGELNDNGSYIPNISAERLDQLTADFIVIQSLTSFGQEDPVELFGSNPLWERLPAVQTGNVTTLPAFVFNGGTYASGILTLEAIDDAAS